MYTVAAIPTRYAGVNFRSRLEAKWAAFFDLVGWRWEYEPIDLNGWIPDFVLFGCGHHVFVEVKPIFDFNEQLGLEIENSASLVIEQVDDDNAEYREALICGACLPSWAQDSFDEPGDHLGIGWLWQNCWDVAPAFRVPKTDHYDFCHANQCFSGRMTGYYEGNILPSTGIEGLWRQAGNEVQWRRRQPA